MVAKSSVPAQFKLRPMTGASNRPGMCGLLIFLGDMASVTAAMALAVFGRYLFQVDFELVQYFRLAPVLLLFAAVYAMHGLYPGITYSPVREIRQLTLSTTIVFVMFSTLLFLFKVGGEFSRSAFLAAWVMALFFVPLTRAGLRAILARKAWWGYPVVIFGACDNAHRIVESLRNQPQLGLTPVAVFDDSPAHPIMQANLPVLGGFGDAAGYAQRFGLTRALIATRDLSGDRLTEMLDSHSESFSRVYIFPETSGLSSMGVEPREMCDQVTLEVRRSLLLPQCQLAKAFIDGSCGLILTVLLAPAMALIALLIKLESRGPAFYRDRRVGHRAKEFRVWKFRTMHVDGDRILQQHFRKYPEAREEWAQNFKLKRDPRVTRLGRFLRKTSLDELPQLWNVLRGEMSLVGPRPMLLQEVASYGKSFDLYCRVVPGLTGLWQVSGRSETDYQQRVDLNTYYVRNWSPWFDIYLLARTVLVVLKGEGAY